MVLFHSCFFSHRINLRGLPLSAITVSQHYLPKTSALDCQCHMRWNAHYRYFSEPLKICCHVIVKTSSRTIRSQVLQPASASKWADMSELQAHHCMTPEQWTWSVKVIPANKLSLQELNQLIRITLMTSDFLEMFGSQCQSTNARLPFLCGSHVATTQCEIAVGICTLHIIAATVNAAFPAVVRDQSHKSFRVSAKVNIFLHQWQKSTRCQNPALWCNERKTYFQINEKLYKEGYISSTTPLNLKQPNSSTNAITNHRKIVFA